MLFLYGILYSIDPVKTAGAWTYSNNIIVEILPILLIVYASMAAFNFIPEEKLKKSIAKTEGFFQYLIMALLGTFSHGPIYAWYPLLSDLNKRGLTYGSIGTYLFSKGIKLTLLPLMFYYFGVKLTILFSLTLFILSFVQGFVIDKLLKKEDTAD